MNIQYIQLRVKYLWLKPNIRLHVYFGHAIYMDGSSGVYYQYTLHHGLYN